MPDTASTGALIGAAALVLSFVFDGHTISKGTWPANALFTVVHVTAAAAWVGGRSRDNIRFPDIGGGRF